MFCWTRHIRFVHIRNLARRQGFGNVGRISGDPHLFDLVHKTLLEYAQEPVTTWANWSLFVRLIHRMIQQRMEMKSKRISFDERDVKEAA